jgi:hypothetical protein
MRHTRPVHSRTLQHNPHLVGPAATAQHATHVIRHVRQPDGRIAGRERGSRRIQRRRCAEEGGRAAEGLRPRRQVLTVVQQQLHRQDIAVISESSNNVARSLVGRNVRLRYVATPHMFRDPRIHKTKISTRLASSTDCCTASLLSALSAFTPSTAAAFSRCASSSLQARHSWFSTTCSSSTK